MTVKRIYNKSISILDTILWKIHSILENKQIISSIKYQKCKQIENAIPIDHAYPVNYNEKDKQLFDHYTGYLSGNETVFQFDNVYVSNEGIVFKSFNNSAACFPHVGFRADYGFVYVLQNYLFRKKIKTSDDKTYVLIYDFWSAWNYYHLLIDTLPRLLSIINELKQDDHVLLLPANCSEFVKRILGHFEITHASYIKENEYFQIKKLKLSYYLAGSGHIHPSKLYDVNQFFINKINSTLDKKKIYMSRSKQKARLVLNEQEIISVVTDLGFEVVYFEDYTFEQQVELCKGVNYLVSSHGANLTNLMWMNEGAKVLELIRSSAPNFCYWALANAAKVDYYYQLCEVKVNDHLLVDIELFKANINKILND
jgi:hypothetical protein